MHCYVTLSNVRILNNAYKDVKQCVLHMHTFVFKYIHKCLLEILPTYVRMYACMYKVWTYNVHNFIYFKFNKLIFLYLKTRCCKHYTLNIVYITHHKLSWIRNLRNQRKFDLHE